MGWRVQADFGYNGFRYEPPIASETDRLKLLALKYLMGSSLP